ASSEVAPRAAIRTDGRASVKRWRKLGMYTAPYPVIRRAFLHRFAAGRGEPSSGRGAQPPRRGGSAKQLLEGAAQGSDRAGAMADAVLHPGREFRHRHSVLGDNEERVVPEAAIAARFKCDAAFARAFAHGESPTGIAKGDGGAKARRAVVV